MGKIVLASKSERRKHILRKVGIDFITHVSDVSEDYNKNEMVNEIVMDIAYKKAIYVASKRNDDLTILSADTVVYCKGKIIGKPKNRKEAFNMLKSFSNDVHSVFTGFCIFNNKKKCILDYQETKVKFVKLEDELINEYLDSSKYLDKAGAYGIQGKGALFVEGIEGCFFNVMGLPISKIFSILST